MDEKVKFLKRIELLSSLNEDQLRLIVPHLEEVVKEKDELVFTTNERGKSVYLVRSGALSLFIGGKFMVAFKEFDSFGEVAVVNESLRTGNVKADKRSVLYKINGTDLVSGKVFGPEISLEILKGISRKVARYLSPSIHINTLLLIRNGEDEAVEFKSTLRYNIHTQKFGKEIEQASLKTIAAFLNTSGGTLLIGVKDDGSATGIEDDRFEDDDHALLHLSNLIKERISSKHVTFVNADVEMVEGKKILRVNVSPSTTPAYSKYNGQEYFYIRTGPSTTDLKVSEVYNYIYNRFYRPVAAP